MNINEIKTTLIQITNICAFTFLGYVIQLALFALWLKGLLRAIKAEKKPILFIGDPALKIFQGI